VRLRWLALPNETVEVRVQLLAGSFLSDQNNRPIRFLRDGKVVKETRTDSRTMISRMSRSVFGRPALPGARPTLSPATHRKNVR